MSELSYLLSVGFVLAVALAVTFVGWKVFEALAQDVMHGVPIGTGRLQLWRWLWSRRLFWFQRRPPQLEFETRLYVGLPGSGKTLTLVRDGIYYMRAGIRVAANFAPVRDPYYGYEAEMCGSWLDMLRMTVDALEKNEPIVFLFDELHNICDARSWQNTPGWWRNIVSQRRHLGVGIMGSTQVVDQVEKRLRTLVDAIVQVHHPLPKWSRLPVVVERWLDARLVESETESAATRSFMWSWVPWWAYAGYSTRTVVASDDFAGYSDEEAAAEVAALTARIADLVRSGKLPAFVEREGDPCPLPSSS